MKTLFVAPHPDDEALFGSYIIMTYASDVAVFITGDTNPARREESIAGCKVLGVKNLSFITDINQCAKDYQFVFIPLQIEGGHPFHNEVSKMAEGYFNETALKYYMTYGEDRHKMLYGRVRMAASPSMQAKKLEALACYPSQFKVARSIFERKDKAESTFN